MSPFAARLVVDNSVISALQEASALARVLGLWPSTWLIPEQVRDEARAWGRHGQTVMRILADLNAASIVQFVSVDPYREGALLRSLPRALGQGEAAAIAIAYHRGHVVAIDDVPARRACDALIPPVGWISTEQILGTAVVDGLLTRQGAEEIWAATGITDSSRLVP